MHALRASAETALGNDSNPLRLARRDGVEGVKAARRSLDVLQMLQVKTLGNLDQFERDTLWGALREVRGHLEQAERHLAELEAQT